MKSVYLVIAILTSMLLSNQSHCQNIRNFSNDSSKYIAELGLFFNQLINKEVKERSVTEFNKLSAYFASETLSTNDLVILHNLSKLMVEKNLKAYPHLFQLISVVNSYCSYQTYDKPQINLFTEGLSKELKKSSTKDFETTLENLYFLVSQSLLYHSSNLKWATNSKLFSFSYDGALLARLSAINLSGFSRIDSVKISGTSGTLNLLTNQWTGNNGKVNWLRAGLDSNLVYALLSEYKIDLKTGKVKADGANLYYKDYFKDKLSGTYEDQIFTYNQPIINFPRFTSVNNDNNIKNLVTDVDCKGTFRLEGNKIIVSGTEYEPAYMWFRKKHKDLSGYYQFIKLISSSFAFDGTRILSSEASMSIYHEYDSIFHPSVNMTYYDSSRIVTFTRTNDNLGICPFIDSYHKIDIKTGMIAWDMDLDEMIFTRPPVLSSDYTATFESDRYFLDDQFDQFKGLDDKHPFFVLKKVSENLNSKSFNIDDVAKYYKLTDAQVQPLIFELAARGFLFYDPDTKVIVLRERMFTSLAAKAKKMDYDVIRFNSSTEGLPNARLNLRNFELNIEGVNDIRLSAAQEVFIKPADKRLIFKKNRDFSFSGKIEAGLFDFYSSKCAFSYDSFLIRMPEIDSMLFRVKPFNSKVMPVVSNIIIKNVIADISGWLYIDSASNKSGLKQLKHFPVFVCDREAYVYYDKKSIQNGAYPRDTFYYNLRPFTIDSLLVFETDGIQFEGKLISGGIFPDIVQPLKVQSDYSLGFIYKTSQKGLPAYDGSGIFYDTVSLSNNGLKGNGRMTFLDSEITSNDITFLPKTLYASSRKATIKGSKTTGAGVPPMIAENIKLEWKPYEQLAIYESQEKKISLFDGKALLDGKINYRPDGMAASGKLSFSGATLESKNMNLTQSQVQTDTSGFSIEAPDKSGPAFATRVDKSVVDFNNNTGKFSTSGINSKVLFPINQFIASMDEFEWKMDKNQVFLKNNIAKTIPNIDQLSLLQLIDTDLKGSEFVSTSPAMDSLQFFTVNAMYDLKENLIFCEDVKIIHVADAAVFPGDGKVLIGKNGKINPLENATIITKNKYHRFDNATVAIASRKYYTGKGTYNYISLDESLQTIHFEKISVDTSLRTIASGKIPETMKFKFNPKFDFKGDAGITADRPHINFDGGFRINSECLGKSAIWVKMNSEINPKDVRIPIGETVKDTANANVYASVFYSVIESKIYPSFFGRRGDYTDSLLFKVNGFLSYDQKKQVFNLGNTDSTGNFLGNHLHFDETKCELNGTGEITTGAGIKPVEMINYGTFRYFYITDSVTFQLASSVNFYFDPTTLEIMAENISQSEVPFNEKFTDNYLMLSGNTDGGSATADPSLQLISKKKSGETMMKTMVFSDLILSWNPVTRSYQSQGPVSLASILKFPVNKSLNGYVEIEKRRGGDVLSIYIETDRREWYFFKYSDNVMQSISSEISFNKILRELDEKDKNSGEITGSTEYRFIMSTTRKKSDFLGKFKGEADEEEN